MFFGLPISTALFLWIIPAIVFVIEVIYCYIDNKHQDGK